MNASEFLATLPAQPFPVPADLTAFRAAYPQLRDDNARFWVAYAVCCPAAEADLPTIRAIVHRLFFRNRVSQGAAADALRIAKVDAIIDHYRAHPEHSKYLFEQAQCWCAVAGWWEFDYPSDDVRNVEL